jgi:hypothetical protein
MPVSNTASRIGLLLGLAALTGCIGDAGAPDKAPAMRASQDAPGEVLARNELTAQWTVVPSLRPSSISPDAIAPPRFLQPPMPVPELVHDFAPPPGSEAPMPIRLLQITASPVSQSGWTTVPSITASMVVQQTATSASGSWTVVSSAAAGIGTSGH